ncbi:response regulator transcription factor [Chryseosolibacter indicus]|uniref:Response regulator n=1 Tax=Chryseosolibacter indicus TaxID=2782351 RepID=A0ABS5VRA5_9BACT|nr:response regulator [Chryseosolibacter indicus]MBT1703967.1 response regulator [Chryseosolibacter indicus]
MKQRITVIDDDFDLRSLLQIALKTEGFDVEAFSNGDEFFQSQSPSGSTDLYIIDINLGGISGTEICKVLKSTNKEVKPLVLLISANPEIQQLATDAGADSWILKPVTQKELISRVDLLLNR